MSTSGSASKEAASLVKHEFKGDLESYLAAWDHLLMSLAKTPDDDLLLALLETQLRKSKAMGPMFVVFDAAPEGSPQLSAKFLYDADRQEVVRKQRESVKDALLNTPQKAAPGKATRNNAAKNAAGASNNVPPEP